MNMQVIHWNGEDLRHAFEWSVAFFMRNRKYDRVLKWRVGGLAIAQVFWAPDDKKTTRKSMETVCTRTSVQTRIV